MAMLEVKRPPFRGNRAWTLKPAGFFTGEPNTQVQQPTYFQLDKSRLSGPDVLAPSGDEQL